MKTNLVIYGAGGLGLEVMAMAKSLEQFGLIGFVDDNVARGEAIYGLPMLGDRTYLSQLQTSTGVVVAIGDPQRKAEIVKAISNPNVWFPSLIHPRAILQMSESITVGEGSIITAGVVVTANVNIGKHVLLNLNATVGHDVRIGDFCSIMPGANISGKVTLGTSVLVGAGANIRNNVEVGSKSIIGMGAAVIRNVPPGKIAVGVPATNK